MNKKTLIITGIIIVLVVVGLSLIPNKPSVYNGFAQCLTDKGVTFFGAFWCPHCQAEKALFGKSVEYLHYVECSTPDGQGQTQACIDKKIKTYPTFEFPDGSRTEGEISLAALAQKTGCILPTGDSTSSTNINTGSSSPVTQ